MSNNFNNENNWRKNFESVSKSTCSSRAAGKKSHSSQWQSPVLWPACSQNCRPLAAVHHGQESSQDCLLQCQQGVLLLLPGWSREETAHSREPLEKMWNSILCLALGTLGNVPMRDRRVRGGPLSHQKLQGRGTGALHALRLSGSGSLQSIPFKSDWLSRDGNSFSAVVENAHLALGGTKGTISICPVRLWNTANRRQELLC